MKNTINYENMLPHEKREKAINDVKEYLNGTQAFDGILKFIDDCSDDQYEYFSTTIEMLCGIQGYPVKALWQTYKENQYIIVWCAGYGDADNTCQMYIDSDLDHIGLDDEELKEVRLLGWKDSTTITGLGEWITVIRTK
jgi:hypothetical protein